MIEIFELNTPLKAISHTPIGASIVIVIITYWIGFYYLKTKTFDPGTRLKNKILAVIILIVGLISTFNIIKEASFNNNLKDIVTIDNKYLRLGTSYHLYKRIPKENVKAIKVNLKNNLCNFEIKYDDAGYIETIKFDVKREDVPHVKECAIIIEDSLVNQIPI